MGSRENTQILWTCFVSMLGDDQNNTLARPEQTQMAIDMAVAAAVGLHKFWTRIFCAQSFV
jgi:hypothetical protein